MRIVEFASRLKPAHLDLILRIAETGQLQRAANLLGMSQPAASRILMEIEARAGGPLFERHPKGMALTALGAVCLRHGKVILEEFHALDREVSRVAIGAAGHVRIGAVTGPAVGTLMPALRQIKSVFPSIELTIEVGPSTELVRGLVETRFDFIISRLPAEYDSRDFRIYPARSEEVSLLVNPDHPLAAQRDLSLADLTDFEWVVQDIGSPIRQAVETAFHLEGVDPPRKITNSSSLLIALSMLEDPRQISPQAREVGIMLVEGPLRARITRLDLRNPITVSPCLIIRDRYRQLSTSAEHALKAVLNVI